ncbi:hypothetical protein ARAM_000400 [Aspergillus rambellii]|uniref:Complex 1 LYR protein domain-containing protein n=1 Tax=Aspergillus rambellii TaxID=308745 RepID=A0A0F8UA73_9EURO|nr:hypothetical protein ARAM_000400 [Aspergillus rambellii]
MSVSTLQRDTAFQVRSLFRSLLRQSSQFSNYNFREYALRRTRDAFREHQKETEDRRIQELMQEGLQSLRMMKVSCIALLEVATARSSTPPKQLRFGTSRQTVISQFYQMDRLVVEGQKTFRSSRSGRQFGEGANRTRTGQIDHDVFEGLPVRRWTRQVQTISQEPKTEGTEPVQPGPGGKQAAPERPMPRDSHLLTPMSRALLRAARSGCIYIRQASKDSEDDEKEATDADEQQAAPSTERSFAMRKWSTVPKHLEAPEVEFLAKRRPGLVSLYGSTAGTVDGANGSAPMRKTRFKKIDPVTGNISIYAAWVPEGHKIEGEVTDEAQVIAENSKVTVTPEAPAPGTVIEGVGVVNAQGVVVAEAGSVSVITPPKRRPPPPKRKAKGFGKGRRKKVMFAPGDGADASLVHGANDVHGSKETDPSRMSADQTAQDDEEDDGEEGEESDDGDGDGDGEGEGDVDGDGDGDGDGDRDGDGEGDESGFDTKTPETPGRQPNTKPEPEPTPGPTSDAVPAEIGTESQPRPIPESSSATVTEATALSAKPPATEQSQQAPAGETSSVPPKKQTGSTSAMPATEEDVEMTDDVLHEPPKPVEVSGAFSPLPKSDTQQQPAPETAKPTQKTPSPPQEVVQSLAPGSSKSVIDNADKSAVEQPEPMDIVMKEPSEPAVEDDVVNMDTSADIPQPPQEPAPEEEEEEEEAATVQKQEPQTNGRNNVVDLLGSLEASLGDKPEDAQSDKQKEAITTHETTTGATPAVPVQSPLKTPAEAPTADIKVPSPEQIAPPIEALTPSEPQPEREPTIQQALESPATEQPPPSTEEQQPEPEPSAREQPQPLGEPSKESIQGTPEQPEATPESVAEQPTTGPVAEPPDTESPVEQPGESHLRKGAAATSSPPEEPQPE